MTRRRVGEARTRGRFLVPDGPIGLSPHLEAFGEIDLASALELIHTDWATQLATGRVSATIVDQYVRETRAMVGYATAVGVLLLGDVRPNLVVRWTHTPRLDGDPVSQNTRLARRSAARAFFMTAMRLGLTDENPADAVIESSRQARYVHRLTDGEIHLLQQYAPHTLSETKTPAALALMEMGSGTREAAHVEVRDVDLLHRRVWVHHGGERFRDRWLPIDRDWCLAAITGRVEALTATAASRQALATTALVYVPRRPNPSAEIRQAAVSQTILSLMHRAGIYEVGVTRPESIREWVAHRVFTESGSVEAVAERLGMSSLDGAAHIVGYDWVKQWGIDAAAPAGRSRRRGR